MEEIKAIVSRSAICNIYNMDETGLFYRLEPKKTLATSRLSGRKKQKERISIVVTSNEDGSHKLPPFIVKMYKMPKAFSRRNISNPNNLGILWASNQKAWMATLLFEKLILDFEKRMGEMGNEKVLLMLDNFFGHQVPNVGSRLRITHLEFLPPSTTSHFQPMDVGIISSFKAQYRKRFIEHQIDSLMLDMDMGIDIYEAVLMVEESWHSGVTSNTIKNCWKHTGILSTLTASQKQ